MGIIPVNGQGVRIREWLFRLLLRGIAQLPALTVAQLVSTFLSDFLVSFKDGLYSINSRNSNVMVQF